MNDIELESPNCPLCGSVKGSTLYEGKRFAPYSVRTCCGCSMSYLSPRLTERAMLSLYQKDQYFSSEDDEGYGNYAAQEPALRATFRRLLQALAARGKIGGTLLEIGCGYGYLLDEARPYFSQRVGTDFSDGAVRQARERADQVYQGGIDAIAETEQFDCVIATHVIEHVYHPQDFVKALLKRLRPGGCLLIAAPDMGSLWRKLMGARWPSFKLPEHVLYFDAHTLERLMNECGMQQVKKVPYPHAFPLPLVASKFGLRLPAVLNRYSLWLPATTVAFMGVKVD
ncbi:MAG: class I SAM-dependent methyltransferase [Nitrososphaera sp.]